MAPAGFHSVTPRMVVSDQEGACSFLRQVFGAEGEVRSGAPAEIRIGDSIGRPVTTGLQFLLSGEPGRWLRRLEG